jgi:uncharacterized protein (DUF2236 family)
MTDADGGGRGRRAARPPLVDAAGAPTASAHSPEDHRPDGDILGHWGLFGPESITWRVHFDPLFGLATLRSLILRALHPEGLVVVFATAGRVDDPWERLASTQRYLGVATFGGTAVAAAAGARLRAVLMRVHGRTAQGRDYRGDDPELLRWMHCCHVSSAVEVTRRGGLDLTGREQELYVREQVRMAALWGLEPDDVPTTRADLTRYFRGIRARLRMTAAARSFIDAVLAPSLPDVMTLNGRNRPVWAPVAGLAYGSLPAWARHLYGTPPDSGPGALSQAATTVALHSLRDRLRDRHDQAGAGTVR